MDRLWRASLIRTLHNKLPDNGVVLDLGTGTADLLFDLLAHSSKRIRGLGLDLSFSMLQLAGEKLGDRARLVQGSAIALPLRDRSFDAVMSAFVLRNVKRIMSEALVESHRLLKPGGRIYLLEMYVPENAALAALHRIYLRAVLPLIGKLLFGASGSQEYLADTIFGFDSPAQFSSRLRSAGFSDVEARPLWGGIAVLHCAAKNL